MLRRSLRAILPLAAILLLVACGGNTPVPHFELHNQLAAGQTLSIRNVSGSVRVEAARDGQVSIVAQGVTQGSRPEPVHVVSNAVGNGLAVCANWSSSDRCESGEYSPSGASFWQKFRFTSRVEVNFVVQLPAGVKLDVRDVNGSVTVVGATSDVLVHGINGSVTASTESGALELKTVNGNVKGDIKGVPTRVSARTVNGTVDVTGPAELAGDLEMSAMNGGIASDFAITTVGNLSRRRLAGHIGTGGGAIELKSINGAVTLHKRA